MMTDGQLATKLTYEDPVIVQGYIKRNAVNPKQVDLITTFSKTIVGTRVLDLGCGPGHESHIFSELGFTVTGLDYSTEMIRQARKLKQVDNPPHFLVGDMKELSELFAENSFDAIWASASLLHIRSEELPKVLHGMTHVARNGAKVYVGLKGGVGTELIEEDKLGKPMLREFTLWSKDSFLELTKLFGWRLDDFFVQEGSLFKGKPAEWLRFFFTISK